MSDRTPVVVRAPGVVYQSDFDEAVFFQWLDKMPGAWSHGGARQTLQVAVDPDALDEDALSEFVGLYRRYHVSAAELQVLAGTRLGSWFSSPDRFWHREIFERPSPVEDQLSRELFSGDLPWNIEPTVGTRVNVWPPDINVSPTPDHVVLKATGVRYYSELDEAAFFEWLDKNPQVESYRGRNHTLYINVNVDSGEEWELCELAALYTRYNIDMTELRVLNSGNFGPWFSDPKWWWHKAVFG